MAYVIFTILIWIMIIGINAVTIVNLRYKKDLSRSKEEIKVLREIIGIYEENEKDLRSCVDYYEKGMHLTLEQNIELKRRLSKV